MLFRKGERERERENETQKEAGRERKKKIMPPSYKLQREINIQKVKVSVKCM